MSGQPSLAGIFAEPLGRKLAGRLPWLPSGALPPSALLNQRLALSGRLTGRGSLKAAIAVGAAVAPHGSGYADGKSDLAQALAVAGAAHNSSRGGAEFAQALALHPALTGAGALASALTQALALRLQGSAYRFGDAPLTAAFAVSGALTNVASSGVTIIQALSASSTTSVASLSAELNSVDANDVIVAALIYGGGGESVQFSIADTQSNDYNVLLRQNGSLGATLIVAAAATAATAATNLVVTARLVGEDVVGLLTVYQLRGASAPVAANCVSIGESTLQPAGTTLQSPSFAMSAGGIAIAGASVYIESARPTFNPITPSAGAYATDGSLAYSSSVQLYCGHVSGTGAQAAETITWTPNPTTGDWSATAVVVPVDPST